MLLPFGLWQGDADRGHWIGVPIMFFVAVLLLGVDAVTNQLENPWKLIPMEAYLNSTITDCRRYGGLGGRLQPGGGAPGVEGQDACSCMWEGQAAWDRPCAQDWGCFRPG